MEKVSLKDKVCILISWALMLTCSAAEREYFPQSRNLTWYEARRHCQLCFKDLVTLTPENTQTISQKLTSDHWVGLSKNLTSTSDPSMFWSHWANGDPLAFQNWYPGWPVLSPGVGIEDSCVVMLSFGAWVEKDCLELLPFICYEDHFFGQANVTNVTSRSAILTWLPGPGNISHYRLEVQGDTDLMENLTGLTFDLVNLTAGTLHAVRVFPVKCERDLNPQEVAFYTTPNKVQNLQVTSVTETSISLSWSKPAGNVDFYLIVVQGRQIQNDTEGAQVGHLTPGSAYTFTVTSGVGDRSTWSEASDITAYTKPGEVSDLSVSENTNNSLLLNWEPPRGDSTGFRVKAMNNSDDVLFDEVVTQTEVRISRLPVGNRITIRVTALASDGLEGEKVAVIDYTAPAPISNLTLVTTHDSLRATWNPPESNYSSFTVELLMDGEEVKTKEELEEPREHFDKLKSATKYSVIVYAVNGGLRSRPVESSIFTLLLPPTDLRVSSFNKEQITLQWKAPVSSTRVVYSLNISSSFWGHSWSDTVGNATSHTFGGLMSGTRYEFEVRATIDEKSSGPAYVSHFTAAEKREISLSMLCSSAESLLCDKTTTTESVFRQLYAHFNKLLGNNIFWELQQRNSENKETP